MEKFKKLFNYMAGFKVMYVLGVLSVLVAQMLNTITPMIISTTIDSLIDNQPIKSNFILSVVNLLGGVEFLKSKIWIVAILMVLVAILRAVFLYLKNTLTSKASENATMRIRNKLYDHIQRLPYEYHVKSETGELIQKCTSDVDIIRRFLANQLMEIISCIFIVLFVLFIMFTMNFKMAIISIAMLPLSFLFAFIFFTKVKKVFQIADEAEGKMSTTIQENLTGVRVVKAFSRQRFEIDKFDEKNEDYRKNLHKLINTLAVYWGVADVLSMSQIGFVVVIGSFLSYKGELSLGDFMAFVSYINMIVWPVRQLGRVLSDMGKASVSLDRINGILAEEIEVLRETNKTPEIKGALEFKEVSFEYEQNKPVLSNISFSAEAGKTIAFIGPTGSGKSSLVHLLPRLYDYTKGSIKVDGMELKNLDKHWIRKNIGIVLQEPFLYARTIKENIRLANPTLEEEKIFQSAQIASIHEDISSFEQGYETLVGERGVSLSGGQKQRMAIARTIIKDSPIVIFDDSLSAVDTETDVSIRKALNTRQNKATTIIISHRISTVSEADTIFVLEKGKIMESGSHQDLINKNGLYKKIYDIQNSLDDELLDA